MEIISIRGHHLDSFARLHNVSLAKHAEDLIDGKYIDGVGDKFADFSYNSPRNLFSNPEQLFKIISDSPDFICGACRLINNCFDLNMQLKSKTDVPLLGGAFVQEFEKAEYEVTDNGVAEKYGFEIGKVYSAKEIRESVGF